MLYQYYKGALTGSMESADYVTNYFFGNNSCETGLVPYKHLESSVQDIGNSE